MTESIVVGIGQCTVEYLGLLPRFPERSDSAEIAEFSQQGGGATATALATLAILGVRTRFVGKISDDHFGQFISVGLESLGVDISHMVVDPDKVSPFSFNAVEMNEGSRTVFWSRGNLSPLAATELDIDAILDGASTLVIDGKHIEAQLEISKAAKSRSMRVVLDAAESIGGIEGLISIADTLIASERLAMELAPASELSVSLKQLRSMGPQTCIITLGSDGAAGIDKNGHIHQEAAHGVKVKDRTGAGFIYLGASTYAMLQNWSIEKGLKFASITAGLACESLGSRAGIPKLSRVLELMQGGPQ